MAPGVDLGVFAALAERARLVIANDTGPGHLAAATGANTLSVLGPTDAGAMRYALVKDPDGYVIELLQIKRG